MQWSCVGGHEPPPDTVAVVGDLSLSVDELADLLVLAQPFPLEPEQAGGLAGHWVLAGVVADALTEPGAFLGPAEVEAATWLERREAVLALEREDRLAPRLPDGVRESGSGSEHTVLRGIFEAGEHRFLAHVLRRTAPGTPEPERDLQRRTAQRILGELVAGGAWSAAVAQSEDRATRETGGQLGVFRAGELPASLDAAAARLEPGEVSSVVESRDGYHILYRPPWEQAAEVFRAALRTRLMAEADGAALEGELADRDFAIVAGAPPALRRIALEPASWMDRTAALATWTGGALSAGTVARYVATLEDAARLEMASLTDDGPLADFLADLSYREMRRADAEARGIVLDSQTANALADRHRADIAEWRRATGDGGPDALSDHLRAVAARRADPPPLGPVLAARMLSEATWELDTAAVALAVERARTMISAPGGADGPSSEVAARLGDPLSGLGEAERGRFLLGRALFERVATADEGLGPLFNADRCVSCHDEPTAGGGGLGVPVRKATSFVAGRCDPLTGHGGDNLQARATAPAFAAGIGPEPIPPSATAVKQVVAPPLFGLGLLEAVPEEALAALADPGDDDGDGISGRLPRRDGRALRFGRKGDAADLRAFVDLALRTELGLTTPEHPFEENAGGSPIPAAADPAPEPEMDEFGMGLLTDYVRYLAPPAPEHPADEATRQAVARGRWVFLEIGCAACHVPELRTSSAAAAPLADRPVRAYTDLLLHDLGGGGLGGPAEDVCGYDAEPGEYRTAPLWGLGGRSRYLHDGSASNIAEAVEAHGGEGASVRGAFRALDPDDRAALIRFLSSL